MGRCPRRPTNFDEYEPIVEARLAVYPTWNSCCGLSTRRACRGVRIRQPAATALDQFALVDVAIT
jgi:hypothetical protein